MIDIAEVFRIDRRLNELEPILLALRSVVSGIIYDFG